MTASLSDALKPILAAERPEKVKHRFGTDDPAELAGWLESFCRAQIGDPLARMIFSGGFAAGVFGLQLESGRKIVVKLHAGRETRPHLVRAYELQEQLRQAGIPCAPRVLPLTEIAPGIDAAAHDFFAPGREEDCATPHHRRELAGFLATINQLLEGESEKGLNRFEARPLEVPAGPGEMLGRIQNRALGEIRRNWSGSIIFHADIKGRNVLIQNGKVSAVYDFDSLQVMPESVGVGAAAVDFTSRRGQMRINLDPEIALGFVREYEAKKQKSFSRKEMEIVRAAAVMRLVQVGVSFLASDAGGIPEHRLASAIDAFDRKAQHLFR